jgi:hypothetical protein
MKFLNVCHSLLPKKALTKPHNPRYTYATERHRTASTSNMAPSTFDHFSSLPLELKEEILRYTLPNNAKINARTHEIMFGPRLISLSLVSRDLHDLAIKTYYQDNIVNYSRSIMIRQYSKDSGPEPASFPDPHPSSQQ